MNNKKSSREGTMRADALAFFFVPLIFLALVFVTAVVILAWQTTAPILNSTENQFHVNATYRNIPISIGGNLYSFDAFLPFIFYMIMIAIIFSAVLLDPDPLSWLVGIVYMPIIYYVSAFISNDAHAIFVQPILTNGIVRLPQSLAILANLPTITAIFGLLYLIALAARVWTFKPGQAH